MRFYFKLNKLDILKNQKKRRKKERKRANDLMTDWVF